MKNLNGIIIGLCLLVAGMACSELPFSQTPTDSVSPAPLSNVTAEPQPGGAKISYQLPAERDISYVRAEYVYNGEKHVIRSSVYNSFVVIEGLGDVAPVDVTLSLVDHSENASAPVKLSFTPEPPPINRIFESLTMYPDFGGVTFLWDNPLGIEIGLTVYIEDDKGIMREDRTQYSLMRKGTLSFRGYEAVSRKFAVKVTDKWNNVSGLKEETITPLYEKLLDKKLFQAVALPGDNTTLYSPSWPLSLLWDNNRTNMWHAATGSYPRLRCITIDVGKIVKFSRMRLFARSNYDIYYYGHYNFQTFEVWGTPSMKPDMPNAYWEGDEWKNDWEQLGDYRIAKPSGNPPGGTTTAEDKAFQDAGFEFMVPVDKEKVRYLRFDVTSTFAPGGMHMAEFDFYGDDN